MVEAATRSADEHRRVLVAEVLEAAHAEAVAAEQHPGIRSVLRSWDSVHAAVGSSCGRAGGAGGRRRVVTGSGASRMFEPAVSGYGSTCT